MMRQGGLKEEDVALVKIGTGSTLVGALESGQVDGFMNVPPNPQEVVRRGKAEMLVRPGQIPEFKNNIFSALMVSQAYASKNAEAMLRVAEALDKAKQYVRTDFEAAVRDAQSDFKGMDEASLRESLTYFIEAYGSDGRMDAEGWKNALSLIREATPKGFKGKFDPSEPVFRTMGAK